MSGSLAPLLITGVFTLGGSLAGSALTMYANSRRERRQHLEAAAFRNLEHRRVIILEFILVYDELRRLAHQGHAARADYESDELFVGHLDDLRRRLGEGRTTLELFCQRPTRMVADEAEQLGRAGWMGLVRRRPASDEELAAQALAMQEHKLKMIDAFRVELGEVV